MNSRVQVETLPPLAHQIIANKGIARISLGSLKIFPRPDDPGFAAREQQVGVPNLVDWEADFWLSCRETVRRIG